MSVRRAIFQPLQGAEFDCAINAISSAALDPSEFVLEERRTVFQAAGGIAVVHKLVSIKRLGTGVQRQYSTGRAGGWPYEFERDLRTGLYARSWPSAPPASSGAEIEAGSFKLTR